MTSDDNINNGSSSIQINNDESNQNNYINNISQQDNILSQPSLINNSIQHSSASRIPVSASAALDLNELDLDDELLKTQELFKITESRKRIIMKQQQLEQLQQKIAESEKFLSNNSILNSKPIINNNNNVIRNDNSGNASQSSLDSNNEIQSNTKETYPDMLSSAQHNDNVSTSSHQSKLEEILSMLAQDKVKSSTQRKDLHKIQIPQFSGKDAMEWIEHYEDICKSVGADDKDMATNFVQRLHPEVYKWYSTLTNEQKNGNWSQLKQLVYQRWVTTDVQSMLQDIHRIRQSSNETFAGLTERLHPKFERLSRVMNLHDDLKISILLAATSCEYVTVRLREFMSLDYNYLNFIQSSAPLFSTDFMKQHLANGSSVSQQSTNSISSSKSIGAYEMIKARGIQLDELNRSNTTASKLSSTKSTTKVMAIEQSQSQPQHQQSTQSVSSNSNKTNFNNQRQSLCSYCADPNHHKRQCKVMASDIQNDSFGKQSKCVKCNVDGHCYELCPVVEREKTNKFKGKNNNFKNQLPYGRNQQSDLPTQLPNISNQSHSSNINNNQSAQPVNASTTSPSHTVGQLTTIVSDNDDDESSKVSNVKFNFKGITVPAQAGDVSISHCSLDTGSPISCANTKDFYSKLDIQYRQPVVDSDQLCAATVIKAVNETLMHPICVVSLPISIHDINTNKYILVYIFDILAIPFLIGTRDQHYLLKSLDFGIHCITLNGQQSSDDTIRDYTVPYYVGQPQLDNGLSIEVVNSISQDEIKSINETSTSINRWNTRDEFNNIMSLNDDHLIHLHDEQRQQLRDVLWNHNSRVAKTVLELGKTSVIKHHLHTGDGPVIKIRQYNTSKHDEESIERVVTEWFAAGIARPSNSNYCNSLLVVSKSDGTARVCHDLRQLNAQQALDSYRLPDMKAILRDLKGKVFKTKIDCESGFNQVAIADEDIHKTAAWCPSHGLFECTRMVFGSKNAPATFQRLMEHVLKGINGVYVFIDDVLIASFTWSEHISTLDLVMTRFQQANLTIKAKKCEFARMTLDYLGHKVSIEGIQPLDSKTAAIQHIPEPNDKAELQSVLGILNYYRDHVAEFSLVARPLYNLLKNSVKWKWTDDCQIAFDKLKQCLMTAPILVFPDYSKPFGIQVDACDYGVGAILFQHIDVEDITGHVIAYASKSFNPTQRNWHINDKECFAIAFALNKFHYYIHGRHIELYTDNWMASHLMKSNNLSPKLARIVILMQKYDITVHHRSGISNKNADALSRFPLPLSDNISFDNEATLIGAINVLDISNVESMKDEQRKDKYLKLVIDYLVDFTIPNDVNEDEVKSIKIDADKYTLTDDQLLITKQDQIVVPESMRDTILQANHSSTLGGHQAYHRTYLKIKNRYYWSTMNADVRNFIRRCGPCEQDKDASIKNVPTYGMKISPQPFFAISIDLTGPFKADEYHNTYILVVSCLFTRFRILAPLKDSKSATVAEALYNNFICIFGSPVILLSDNAQAFLSSVWFDVMKLLKISSKTSSAYHAQGNAITERVMRDIKSTLRRFIVQHKFNWSTILPSIAFAINTSQNRSTGFSPYYLVFGREARNPVDSVYDISSDEYNRVSPYLMSLVKRLSNAHDIVDTELRNIINKHRVQNEKLGESRLFQIGDKVRMFIAKPCKSNEIIGRKLLCHWLGPFVISEVISPINYRVTCEYTTKADNIIKYDRVVHVSRIKLYNEPVSVSVSSGERTIINSDDIAELDEQLIYDLQLSDEITQANNDDALLEQSININQQIPISSNNSEQMEIVNNSIIELNNNSDDIIDSSKSINNSVNSSNKISSSQQSQHQSNDIEVLQDISKAPADFNIREVADVHDEMCFLCLKSTHSPKMFTCSKCPKVWHSKCLSTATNNKFQITDKDLKDDNNWCCDKFELECDPLRTPMYTDNIQIRSRKRQRGNDSD